MEDERSFLIGEFADKKAREQYAADLLNAYIALQIKTLRQQRGWSQEQFAEYSGKFQSQISAMEQIDYRSWKISTLRQLARAFDLALVVKFESFGRFLDDVLPVERAVLERPSFEVDPAMVGSAGSLGTGGVKGSPAVILKFPTEKYAALDSAGIASSSTSQKETIAIHPEILRRG